MVQIDPLSIGQPKSILIIANLVDINCRTFNVGNWKLSIVEIVAIDQTMNEQFQLSKLCDQNYDQIILIIEIMVIK
jgi:hypothetical protein